MGAVSSKLYKRKREAFSVVTRVSLDGVYFLTKLVAFIDEARAQSQEVYGLPALANDVHMVREAASWARAQSRPGDDLYTCDFFMEQSCSLGELPPIWWDVSPWPQHCSFRNGSGSYTSEARRLQALMSSLKACSRPLLHLVTGLPSPGLGGYAKAIFSSICRWPYTSAC